MEALKKFKIQHLSASSLNLFLNNPALWVLQYIYGFKFKTNEKALRGTLIERGVNIILSKNDDPIKTADYMYNDFVNECERLKIDKKDYEQQEQFIKKAIVALPKHLSQYGKLIGYQQQIGYDYKGIHLKGYTDFEFDKPVRIDLKTTNKINVTIGHKISQSIYSTATNMENKLFYVKVLKTKPIEVMEYKLTDEDNIKIPLLIHSAIENINYLCGVASSKDDFKRLITPNPDDFYWNKAEDKVKARKDIWGF